MADPVKTGEFFWHVTGPGERWDTVAHKFYNDASLSHVVIKANRGEFIQPLAIVPDLIPSGTKLRIPVIEENSIDTSLLPPWNRT